MATNIYVQKGKIGRQEKQRLFKHKSVCIWLTGLSGSGKSTIAYHLEKMLFENDIHSYVLDGDNLRYGLNSDLDFSPEERKENIRRAAETAALFVDAGLIVITSFISPFRDDRAAARKKFNPDEFIEVYINCSLEVCRERDPKGLYEKAFANEIKDLTGVNSPYEVPENPELILESGETSTASMNALILYEYLKTKGIIN